MLGNLSLLFWLICLGLVSLFAYLVALGALSPGEVVAVTIVVAVLIVLLGIHFIRVRRALDERVELRQQRNKLRERRGF